MKMIDFSWMGLSVELLERRPVRLSQKNSLVSDMITVFGLDPVFGLFWRIRIFQKIRIFFIFRAYEDTK